MHGCRQRRRRGKLDPAGRTSLSRIFHTQLHPGNGGWLEGRTFYADTR
jgi:hypothetical protein